MARSVVSQPQGSPTRHRGGARPPASRRHQRAAVALILAVSFMVVLDFSIVNVALASIERELHSRPTDVQWVVTAYAITFGGLLVLGGRLGDFFGRRRMFISGLVLFSFASLAGGMAPSLGVLIVARAVQGLGAAIVAPSALSLLTTTTAEGKERTRALGYYGATASLGYVAGLVLGGLLVQFFDWRSVLWVNVPVGLLAASLAPYLVRADPIGRLPRGLDLTGAFLVTGSIAAVVYGVSQGPTVGWASVPTVTALVLFLAMGVGFFEVERQRRVPLVRLEVFRMRQLRVGNMMMLLAGAWAAGVVLVVPMYLQLVMHLSPLLTGLAMAPQGAVGFVGATQGPRFVRLVGVRAFLMASGAAAVMGLVLLAVALDARSFTWVVVGLMLVGYGTSTAAFGSTVAATQGLANEDQGLAGGLINMSRQVGAAIGVAVVAAIIGTAAMAGGSVVRDSVSLAVMSILGVLAVFLVVHELRYSGSHNEQAVHATGRCRT